jgi:hypothetical protein
MTRLRDKAVEAMVERLGVMYPKWHPTNRRIVAIRLLAALPAGVYYSDGQGKVTSGRDDMERVIESLVNAIHGLDSYAELGGAPMERTMRANGAVADARDFLASLSATDTEGQ